MKKLNRRRWLKQSSALTAASIGAATAGTGFWTETVAARTMANDKLNLAFIGVGGRGAANLGGLKNQNLVAFCDVDGERAKKAYEAHPEVAKFQDYRKMLDALENKIDGVVISTPDHMHFHPSLMALEMGKHLYLEKPLAHTVWETRTLCNLAKEKNVATQLGVQRHTTPNMHRVVEMIRSGAIGDVSEVYCWVPKDRGMPNIPKDRPAVPADLNYDLWIGAAPERPYHPSITPYGWRFWWDYGTGETGNWGCHVLDIPYWALDLKYPTKVSGSGPEVDAKRSPKQMQSSFEFPANEKRGPIKLHWDHAKQGPSILKQHDLPHKDNNTLFVGSEGMLLCGFGKMKLYPEEKFGDHKAPDQSIPKSPGFYNEWIAACQGGETATCSFEYSGPMAETVLLGNVAYRTKSEFDWDHVQLKASDEAAQKLITKKYRKGWEVEQVMAGASG